MDTQTLIILLAAGVGLLAVIATAWLAVSDRRSKNLREKYGPEYDYTLEQSGDRQTAEKSLIEREKRIDKLDIRELDERESDLYHTKWVEIQADFVDQPAESVERANGLINEVMEARGFPTAEYEQRASDISVIYPELVTNYRNAHTISEKARQDGVSTEDLRQAIVDYRSLFEELLRKETIKEKEVKVS
jgi:hypothetical protein